MAGMTDIVILGVVAVGIIYVATNPSVLTDLGAQLKIPAAEGSTTETTPTESETTEEEEEGSEEEDEGDKEEDEEEDSNKAFLYGYAGRRNYRSRRRKLNTRRFSGESYMLNNIKVKRIAGAYNTIALPPLHIYSTNRVLTL